MNIKNVIFILCIVSGIFFYFSPNTLEQKLQNQISEHNAEVGIAIIKGNEHWLINNNKTYPMLSVFKIFVAAAVLNKIEKENTSLNTPIIISKETMYPTYSPLRDKIKQYPYQSSIEELLMYMIAQSDNIATDILISYLGGIEKLNYFITSTGFSEVIIKANEKQMNEDIQKQKLNTAHPQDIAAFIKAIDDGKILSPKQTNIFRKIMQQTQTGKNKLKSGLPDNIIIGHKTGSSDRDKNGIKIGDNDAGFVILPNKKTYYIAVLIKDSKMSDEQNANLISQISKLVYEELR